MNIYWSIEKEHIRKTKYIVFDVSAYHVSVV